MESSWKRQASYSQMQQLGLVEEYEGSESSDDYVFEEEKDATPEQLENEIAEIINEFIPIQDQQTDHQDNFCTVPLKKKGTRGPSMCKDVHGWTINDRKLLF